MASSERQEKDLDVEEVNIVLGESTSPEDTTLPTPLARSSDVISRSPKSRRKPIIVEVEDSYQLYAKYDDAIDDFPCKVYRKSTVQLLDYTKCVPYSSIGSDQDINFQYIVAYPLADKEEGLKSILEKLAKEIDNVQGLVVMTTTDTATLHYKFWDVEDCDFVVYAINQAEGKILMEILRKSDLGEVSVFAQKVSSVDVPPPQTQISSRDHKTAAPLSLPKSTLAYPLHKQLKEYFENLKKQDISREIFIHIMTHFKTFENRCQGSGEADKGLKLLKEYVSKQGRFMKEMLLHLVIVHRISLKEVKQVYHGSPRDEYLIEFFKKTEDLFSESQHQVVTIVKKFTTSSSGDFPIPWIGGSGDVPIFSIMKHACMQVAASYKEDKGLRSFGLRMFWYHLFLRFCDFTVPKGVWSSILKAEKCGELPPETDLKFIKKAVNFGHELSLPEKAIFSGEHLAELVVGLYRDWHFTRLSTWVKDFDDCLLNRGNNLMMFMRTGFSCSSSLFVAEHFTKLSSSANTSTTFQEGVGFLCDAIQLFQIPKGPDQQDQLGLAFNSIELWLKALLQVVLVKYPEETVEGINNMRKRLKDSDRTTFKSRAWKYLSEVLNEELRSAVHQMRMDQFVVYARNIPNIPIKIYEELLQNFSLKYYENLVCQPAFMQMVAEFFKSWKKCPAQFHRLFARLLLRAGERHHPPKLFIPSLLQLNCPQLLSQQWVKESETADLMEVRRNFKTSLNSFIQKEKLGQIVPVDFKDFILDKPSSLTPLQDLVLSLLTSHVYVKNKSDLGQTDRTFTKTINSVDCLKLATSMLVKKYKEEPAWQRPPDPPYTFYWDILYHACQLVQPASPSDLNWCTVGSTAVPLLAQVFSAYNKVHGTRSLVGEEQALSACKDENMKRYFQWIQSIQQFIQEWQGKITEYDYTMKELFDYANAEILLSKIAQSVFVEATINVEDTVQLKTRMSLLCDEVRDLLIKKWQNNERCSLMGILASYHISPREPLHSLLMKGISRYQERLLKTIVFVPEETDNHEFFKETLKMKDLLKMNDALQVFLTPLADHIDFLVHFVMNKSHLFKEYLEEKLKELEDKVSSRSQPLSPAMSFLSVIPGHQQADSVTGMSVADFCTAVEMTSKFLRGILTGQTTYGTLCSLGCFQDHSVAGSVDVDKELQIIQTYPFKGVEDRNLTAGIKSILKLIQFSSYLENIIAVCDQYKLTGCLKDEGLKKLEEIHGVISSEEGKIQLTGVRSEEYLTEIREVLGLKECDEHCLNLFGMLRDSTEFYQFLKEKNYKGSTEGPNYFHQHHTLITQQLQHEEYNEQVLNHLLVAFRYISPFLESDQSLKQMMEQVYKNAGDQSTKYHSTAFCQLQTVNKNIHLVRLWFTRAEGDSLESIADDLKSLLTTGEFEFIIPEADALDLHDDSSSPVWWKRGQERKLHLHYCPSSAAKTQDPKSRPVTPESDGRVRLPSQSAQVTWDLERIEDFTRRLGFLEKGQENQDHTKFQQLSSLVQRMFTVQCKLKDLGYPLSMDRRLPCFELQRAKNLLTELEGKLKDWRSEVKQLQKKYDKLLFFSVPKVLKIATLLREENFQGVLWEILFLFNSQVCDWNVINQGIKDAATHCVIEQDTPIAFVGLFLEVLYSNERVVGMSFPTRSIQAVGDVRKSTTWKPTCVMHLADELDLKDLIRLIVEIYNGIPGPYQVYRCRPDSTEEELTLFFHRIMKFTYLEYMILNVELLTPKLQEVLLKLHLSLERSPRTTFKIHYIAAKSTVLQGMPHLTLKEHKSDNLKYEWKNACTLCKELLNGQERVQTYLDFQLVYGGAGNGKTHYIKQKIRRGGRQALTIAVNESFNARTTIRQMRSLEMQPKSVIYFSFTLIPPSPESTSDDVELYNCVMTQVWWFLFDLFFLGYVEDPDTGISFCMPQNHEWSFYFEVPIREGQDPEMSLELFCKEFPVLELIGRPHRIREDIPYRVDKEVQLVCKYLHAFELKDNEAMGINRRHYRPPGMGLPGMRPPSVDMDAIRFSILPDLSEQACHRLLAKYMPEFVKKSKMQQKLFIGYMRRRCQFLETFPAFNYNQGGGTYKKKDGKVEIVDTSKMGSTLMETMILEVTNFCDPGRRDKWSYKDASRQQLVYSNGTFGLVIVNPDRLSSTDRQKYKVMGVDIPESHELSRRGYLDKVLGMALTLKQSSFRNKTLLTAGDEKKKVEVLKSIEDQQYVLTLDYTLKMLEIHERFECGVPVIIEGETGVGKTALVEMLSILWNDALLGDQEVLVSNIYTLLIRVSEGDAMDRPEVMTVLVNMMQDFATTKLVSLADLEKFCSLGDQGIKTNIRSGVHNRDFFIHELLLEYVVNIVHQPVVSLLDIESVEQERHGAPELYPKLSFKELVTRLGTDTSYENVAHLLFYILRAGPLKTFHKLNIHAALTPKDYMDFFRPAINQANHLKEKWNSSSQLPKVTVFLDEINTASCLGLLKEVIVDGTFFGEPLPENLFIIAACNPHRGNSIIVNEQKQSGEMWMRSTYNVHRLPPTIQTLMWDYGALDGKQEKQYVEVKMRMISSTYDNDMSWFADELSNAIIHSQVLMRTYAAEHLKSAFNYPSREANSLAHSCVSQRDIQRVFTLFEWLMKGYQKFKDIRFDKDHVYHATNPGKMIQEHAILGALAIVYYMRLNDTFRERYRKELGRKMRLSFATNIDEALQEELDFYAKHLSIPRGIAKTRALMENLFCIIACCCTRTPLIIVGAPGSSKTLSFNLALSNLKGAESKMALFRHSDIYPSLDPHFYQCSRRTTSTEVETVFQRAIKRQSGFNELGIPINCVVFMDEAGLPEESHESLKVLHKYLDSKEVAFVAISNHPLDAAKTNRAVSLFRVTYTERDIKTLAKECLGAVERSNATKTVEKLCEPYVNWMKKAEFSKFFGLRDFIHFIHYLRRKEVQSITTQLVMEALERNFNGFHMFNEICKGFLKQIQSAPEKVNRRSIVEVLRDSLSDQPNRSLQKDQEAYDEVRYKLIIDPSEDGSVSRLLTMYKVLHPKKTRIFLCSEFPEDSQLQKVNTIAAIRHAAEEGKTVLMSQTDDIHESFYDLFNQHFRRIDNPDPTKEPKFYANIAIGSHHKPCRVHKDFQCVVIIKESEVKGTPAPFLNRFEKYQVSHKDFLRASLDSFPPCMGVAVTAALEKVKDFFNFVGEDSFYGAKSEDTVDSLAVSILPTPDPDFKYVKLLKSAESNEDVAVKVASAMKDTEEASIVPVCQSSFVLLKELLNILHSHCGFRIGQLPDEELQEDAVYILKMLCEAPSDFKGIAQAIQENRYSEEDLKMFVHEAVDHLHLAPSPQSCKTDYGYIAVGGISSESCFVVMVFVQWLVQYMCKHLLQLMTAEALTLYRKQIPLWCLNTYLRHQSHFCLKNLIEKNLSILRTHPKASTVSTKLVCFTRFTPDINRLPTVYPPDVIPLNSSTTDGTMIDIMRTMICEEPYNVYLCKLSNISSEQAFHNYLQSFINSVAKVMVLVINMQETKKQMVNHIRIMVEQAEGNPLLPHKLFVLLLHFPPSMFYDRCYPALFLNGWDHHYFDSLQPEPEGIVDIRLWFSVACQRDKSSESSGIVRKAAEGMLDEMQTANTIASRIAIGAKLGGEFNSIPKNGNEVLERFQKLLKSQVGSTLCDMYANYWKPSEMARYLEEAASYARNRKSTISMADSVGDFFQTAFHNFLAYMINMMNEGLNLDNVYKAVTGDRGATEVERIKADVFLQLMRYLPTPKLMELKAYNNNWNAQQALDTRPSFPFFHKIYSTLDALLEESERTLQSDEKVFDDNGAESVENSTDHSEEYFEHLQRVYHGLLKQSLEEDSRSLLSTAINAMSEHPQLWQLYWTDFIAAKFHLDMSKDDLTTHIFNLQIARVLCQTDYIERVASLHCLAHTRHINMAKFLSSLRPIQQLQSVFQEQQAVSCPSPRDELKQLVQEDLSQLNQGLVQFITDTMFQAFSFGCLKFHKSLVFASKEDLDAWRRAYHAVTVQPSVKELLFQTKGLHESYEGKLNVMTAVFFLLQTRGHVDETICQFAFEFGNKLLAKFFDDQLQESYHFPNLKEIVLSYGELRQEVCHQNFSEEDNCIFLENLLKFFFTVKTVGHREEDVSWFLKHVNCISSPHTSLESQHTPVRVSPLDGLPMSILQHILGGILTCLGEKEKPIPPLMLFHSKAMRLVTAALLEDRTLGDVEPYKPPMYRQLSAIRAKSNPRMTQPLADLYFLVVLEQLMGEGYSEMNHNTAFTKMKEMKKFVIQNWNKSSSEKILLHIEMQAVMQIFLHKVAESLASENLRSDVLSMSAGICDIVTGEVEGLEAREATGNELVILMHLLKEVKGPGQLINLLKNTRVADSLSFLKSYREELEQGTPMNVHFWPFMLPGATGQLAEVYASVADLMMDIVEAEKDENRRCTFVHMLQQICNEDARLVEGDCQVDRRAFVRMTIWLTIYYNNIRSSVLKDLILHEITFVGFTREHQLILECFLCPNVMKNKCREETPLPNDVNAEVLEITGDGGVRPKQYFSTSAEKVDPIYMLFEQDMLEGIPLKVDPSDMSLRNALANLVAVVFSLPPRSTHLWYLFHNPAQLRDTYMPGFMYPHKVNKNKMLYDCGILLNEDGQFGRPEYRDHHSGLSLHSFYLLTWATFGTLCMSLLTNPSAQAEVHGHLISEWQPLRHFCLQQLRHIWLSLQTNLELNNEERDFFIVETMFALFKKGQSLDKPPGVFDSPEELHTYENMWHRDVYDCSMRGMKDRLKDKLDLHKNYLFTVLNQLDTQYPRFPSEKQLKNNLVSVHDCAMEPKHTVLSHFLEDRHRLAVGGTLLPDLVEFYLWLDVHLAHLIKYEVAQTMTVGHLIDRASQRFPSEATRLMDLFARMKDKFNQYIKLNGGVLGAGGCHRRRHDEVITAISTDTPVINFLSTKSDLTSRGEGEASEANDWLYLTITDIVNVHNNLIDLADAPLFISWMPSEVDRVDVREFSSELDRIFSGSDKWLLSLIQSRYIPSSASANADTSLSSIQHARTQAMFDLSKLESDVVRYFIAGKRTLEVATLRKPFRFRDDNVGTSSPSAGLAGPGVPVDLAALSQELPFCCKEELSEEAKKELESDFHDANYNTLSELVTCLKTASGYMYRTFEKSGEGLLEDTLINFLKTYFDAQEDTVQDVFSKIGLDWECFKPEQLRTLEKVKLKNLFKTLEMFVRWISDCLFDFHMLPFSVKIPLSSDVLQTLERDISTQGNLEAVEGLESTVSLLAVHFGSESTRFQPTQSLRQYLIDLQFYDGKDLPDSLLPAKVQIQHYMYYVVLLRKLKLSLKKGAATLDGQPEQHTERTQWTEMVPNVWAKLPHFQDNFKDLLLSNEDFVFELNSLMYPIQLEDDNVNSDGTGSEIWLDMDPTTEPQESSWLKSVVVIDNPDEDVSSPVEPERVGEPEAENDEKAVHEGDNEPIETLPPVPSQPEQSPSVGGQSIAPSLMESLKVPSEKAVNMTVDEVVQWLGTINLGKHGEVFRSEEVDGELLATYDLKDLEDMGISLQKDRKKILVKFRRI